MYLETPRLILRNLKGTDLQAYLRFHNSEFVLRYNAMAHQSAEEAAEFIRGNLVNDRHVAIARKDTDAFIGLIHIEDDSCVTRQAPWRLLTGWESPTAPRGS